MCAADQFQEYFERYGKVTEAQIMQDHTSGRSRGFGYAICLRLSSTAQHTTCLQTYQGDHMGCICAWYPFIPKIRGTVKQSVVTSNGFCICNLESQIQSTGVIGMHISSCWFPQQVIAYVIRQHSVNGVHWALACPFFSFPDPSALAACCRPVILCYGL